MSDNTHTTNFESELTSLVRKTVVDGKPDNNVGKVIHHWWDFVRLKATP